jgi:Spy/CpxP family protein refolding chaperone
MKMGTNLTPEQRAQKEAELRVNFERDFAPAVSAVFADQTARQRYNQLYLQYQGYGAFQDPIVQQQLNLTPQQQQQFNQFATDWNRQYTTWVTTYPTNREHVGKAFREARRDARHRITTVLTPAQQTTWTNMTGHVYEFQPEVYFPAQTTTTTTLKPVVP